MKKKSINRHHKNTALDREIINLFVIVVLATHVLINCNQKGHEVLKQRIAVIHNNLAPGGSRVNPQRISLSDANAFTQRLKWL